MARGVYGQELLCAGDIKLEALNMFCDMWKAYAPNNEISSEFIQSLYDIFSFFF